MNNAIACMIAQQRTRAASSRLQVSNRLASTAALSDHQRCVLYLHPSGLKAVALNAANPAFEIKRLLGQRRGPLLQALGQAIVSSIVATRPTSDRLIKDHARVNNLASSFEVRGPLQVSLDAAAFQAQLHAWWP